MLKRFPIFLTGIIFCYSAVVFAQPTIDTISNCLKQKPRLFGKFDTRNSFIDNSRAKVMGLKFGLNYGNRLQFGLGYNQFYGSVKNFDKKINFTDVNNLPDSTTAKLHLYYFSIHTEYVYYKSNRWQLSIPLQLGVGQTYYKYQTGGINKTMSIIIVYIYEPSVSIEYKIIKWLGVGADVGFRFMVADCKKLNQKFNSPTYAFKLLIYYGEIYRLFKKR